MAENDLPALSSSEKEDELYNRRVKEVMDYFDVTVEEARKMVKNE